MASQSPRTKEKEVRISEIEDAAKEVFRTKGYQAATMQEIAERAGVAKGTVYLYYSGKEDLYSALMLPSLQYLETKLRDLLQDMDGGKYESGPQLLRALADLLLELHYSDPDRAMLYQTFQIGNFFADVSDGVLSQLTQAGKSNFGLLREICARAVERGLFRSVDVVSTVDSLWGLFVGVAQVEWNKLRWTGKDHLRDTLHHAFSLMWSGLSPDGS